MMRGGIIRFCSKFHHIAESVSLLEDNMFKINLDDSHLMFNSQYIPKCYTTNYIDCNDLIFVTIREHIDNKDDSSMSSSKKGLFIKETTMRYRCNIDEAFMIPMQTLNIVNVFNVLTSETSMQTCLNRLKYKFKLISTKYFSFC